MNENIEKNNLKVGGYISEIEFNEENIVKIDKNDIIVLVGPNNVGKSQSLKDIYVLCDKKIDTKVIKNIKITKNMSKIKEYLRSISKVSKRGSFDVYTGYKIKITDMLDKLKKINENEFFDEFRDIFVNNLTTEDRLCIVNPTVATEKDSIFTHPIHFAVYDYDKETWLSDNFKKAFNNEITAWKSIAGNMALYIGERKSLDDIDEKKDAKKALSQYSDLIMSKEQVNEQGDGVKSFTGILLNLMIDRYCTFLIDEPESFLHPPQAKIMGKVIAEKLNENQQAFISTHSEELIKGLLEVAPERVKIIRLERENNVNKISVLQNEKIKEVWNDPILKYSNIMSSLFHKNVVLCESDSDCKMYSIISNHLHETQGKYDETLFIHCGGKHRMDKVISALKSLNIDTNVIVDADVLNDENILKRIVEPIGIDWENQIQRNYRIIESNLHKPQDKIKLKELNSFIQNEIGITDKDLTDDEIKKINDFLKIKSKWSGIKQYGVSAIPSGDAKEAFNEINKILQEKGIFIVPVGEIENFIKEVGGHGPSWVESVIEKYPNVNSSIYDDIKMFIKYIFDKKEKNNE